MNSSKFKDSFMFSFFFMLRIALALSCSIVGSRTYINCIFPRSFLLVVYDSNLSSYKRKTCYSAVPRTAGTQSWQNYGEKSQHWPGTKKTYRERPKPPGTLVKYSNPEAFDCKLRASFLSWPGLKKPAGTGPVTAVTGLTGPDRFRFRPVSNRPKFKF